jgi:hypothetical protein
MYREQYTKLMQQIYKAQDSPTLNPTGTFLSYFCLGYSRDLRGCGNVTQSEVVTPYRRFRTESPLHTA